ncbi:MAG: response regulator [Actinomycetota bacterium]|nr:response regulator [Actinomycetota bacterium]
MSESILIVDDDITIVNLLEKLLKFNDFETRVAYSGREALRFIKNDPPDLVLLDIMMPEMDGFQVLIELRGDPATNQMPVVLLTALDDDGHTLGDWVRKTDGYVTKPFEPSELIAVVRMVLDRSLEERAQERAKRVDSLLEMLERVEEGRI